MDAKFKDSAILPGRGSLLAAGTLLLLSVLAFGRSDAWWLVGAGAGLWLALAAGDVFSLRRVGRRIKVVRELPPTVGRGVPFTVMLRVAADLPRAVRLSLREILPESALPEVCFATLRLPARAESAVHTYTVTLPQRGDYVFPATWLRLPGRWGMLVRQWAVVNPVAVKVYPECITSPGELAEFCVAAAADKSRLERQRGGMTEFLEVTPMRPGDPVRRIDWRASARARQLLVRRYQIEQSREVLLLLDCGRLMGADAGGASKLDRAVNGALQLGQTVLARGDKCGVGAFDDQVRVFLPPRREKAALARALYNLRSEFRDSDFSPLFALLRQRQKKRALIIILSDLADAASSGGYRAALQTLAKRHLVVLAALRTSLLARETAAPVREWADAARKAAAWRLERERAAALHALARSGVEILDVSPEGLTAPLINAYLSLRRGGRL